MINYGSIDVTTLTLEDALSDESWGRRPWDYTAFLAVDVTVLEGFASDFTDAEIVETMRAISAYCVSGEVPDYDHMSTTAVKVTVRTLVRTHDARLNTEFLKHYRQYVSAMKKRQDKQA